MKELVAVINAVFFAGFLVAAALEFRRRERWPGRIWSVASIYCACLLTASVIASACMFALAPPQAASHLSRAVLGGMLPRIAATFIFLCAMLSLPQGRISRRREKTPARRGKEMACFAAAMLLLSYGWLALAVSFFDAHIAPQSLALLKPRHGEPQVAVTFSVLVFVYLAPFFEEVVYRGYIQQKLSLALRRWRPSVLSVVLPVVIPAALWGLLHVGALVPDWVKWTQIFVIGLILGVARLRLGLGACVVLHLLFNLLGGIFAPAELVREPLPSEKPRVVCEAGDQRTRPRLDRCEERRSCTTETAPSANTESTEERGTEDITQR